MPQSIEQELDKQVKKYYMNSYYIRYLVSLHGDCYEAIADIQNAKQEDIQREKQKTQENKNQDILLRRDMLSKCCEHMKYEVEDERKLSGALPMQPESFVEALCNYFQVNLEDVCVVMEENGRKDWDKIRKQLRTKRDSMVWESNRLEDILIAVLKLCDAGYLSKTARYLTDMLLPCTREFWAKMQGLLDGLNLYLGYPEVIEAGLVETGRGWDYPVKNKFGFQKNELLDSKILASLTERQGYKSMDKFRKALSRGPKMVSKDLLKDIRDGKGRSETSHKKEVAERMGCLLHASWEDLKGEGERFWTNQGIALWKVAEEQMRRAVQSLKPKDWEGLIAGNEAANGIVLGVKNVIRFSLCCHEPEENRRLLEILEKKISSEDKASEVDNICRRCIRELKEEQPFFTELAYRLLLNGMNVELRLEEAFDGEWEEAVYMEARETVDRFCREEGNTGKEKECSDEEKEKLAKEVLWRKKEGNREELFREFQEAWLKKVKQEIITNPWFHNAQMRVVWTDEEEGEEPLLLEDTIAVRIELPQELVKYLEQELGKSLKPGEITARLPYERGKLLDEVVCQNWSVISDALDDSFGLELEGWEAELYEVWVQNVEFRCEKLHYTDWEPYSLDNREIDQMIPDERYENRYRHYVELGKQRLVDEGKLEESKNEIACYEVGILLHRREAGKWR